MKTKLKTLKHNSHTIALSKGIFAKKRQIFCKKILASAKLRGPWYYLWNVLMIEEHNFIT